MSTPNDKDEAFVSLADLALGILPAADAARLMAIVQSSPALQAELASLRGAANALAHAAPSAPMAADKMAAMRERLMARAAAEPRGDTGAGTDAVATTALTDAAPNGAPSLRLEPRESRATPIIREGQVPARLSMVQRMSPFLAIAATAAFGVALFRLQDILQERNNAEAALRVATVAATQMSTRLAVSDSLIAAMSGANVRVVNMVSTQKLAPGAKMFWDRIANRWTMITHDLPAVKNGRTYQLWLVTAKAEKISAGTFNTDARGRAVVQATYALAESDLAAIAITEEPTGGSPQPTGTILVAGAATH
jgi:anti-sigma-K factor RskA